MYILRFLLLVAALSAGQAQAAQVKRTPFQIRCEDTISKTVSVLSARQSGYTVNTQLSYKQLSAMKTDKMPATGFVLGLTRTESRVQIGLDGPMLTDPVSGYECVAPQIKVQLTYAPVRIYVGNEFPPGSCGYAEILSHELRHMNAYMEHLPKVEEIVRSALARRFEAKPLYAPAGTARSALAHEIDSGWMPYIKAEMAKVEALQAAIDSPAEYARLGKACNGEIQSILRKSRSKK
ncbi:hypothetical protein [Pseudoduganella sp. OTU4001]|uniref:hypothetical protein n=1 Tax=Pseudoduganella sp. OTU4001 TaxID=3043854 RepID=UPI00313BF708